MMQKTHRAFYRHVNLQQYRSILALNGELPSKSFFNVDLPVIAADGAANTLHKLGIKPKIIVGDLDTVDPKILKTIESVYVSDQGRCDFEKALKYVEQSNLLPTIIVGASGGYIDHILNNISLLIDHGGIFYAPPIACHVLKTDRCKTFSLPINTKISLIGAMEAIISTNGLKWELNRRKLLFAGTNSCFNRSIKNEVLIKRHSGACLVMVYLENIHDAGEN